MTIASTAASSTPVAGAALHPAASTTATRTAAADGMGKEAFLQLLVAQLRNQDPLNPLQGAEFIAQTAQFALVERIEQMAAQGSEALAMQRNATAAGLLGRSVTSPTASGAVSAVRFEPGGPVLVVDGVDVPLARVTATGVASTP